MSQYDKFLSHNNFTLAFYRLKSASLSLYKTIYYEDLKLFELFLEDNIESVINSIKQDIYTPQECHKIFIPKKDNLIRPLSVITFIDLLVYQALTNIIADSTYDIISPYYENMLFGNIVVPTTSKTQNTIFFYKSWKKRWNKFNSTTKKFYNSGYKYLSEFDIASFFDTIDHHILCQLLENNYKIESKILDLLSKCLETWTADSNHKTFKSKHGIPQGPLASPLLADLYLFYLDLEIKKIKKQDFKYIRYVDDIRIFTKDEITSKKIIAALDLLSRDLGLIPQGNKILTKEITDLKKEIQNQNEKFSDIAKQYYENNEGKPTATLSSKTHKNLKLRFQNCFVLGSPEKHLDKTVISFSLFKLNKDPVIKELLLKEYPKLFSHFEAILFYFQKHYYDDKEILDFIGSILKDDNILFKHLIALCFKYFPNYPFDEKLYQYYTVEKHRHWLVNYFMIAWLFNNNKDELILTDFNSSNYFILRELNKFKFAVTKDFYTKKITSKKMLSNTNPMIALQGLNFLVSDPKLLVDLTIVDNYNPYIKFIFKKQPSDIINHILKEHYKIENSESFFNENIWIDNAEYKELQTSFFLFYKHSNSDASKALLNLNSFNNLVFDKICNIKNIPKPSKEYGVNLQANLIEQLLPLCNKHWLSINEKRNQNSEAHPYDRTGSIRIRITIQDFTELHQKQISTLEEICSTKELGFSLN